ncbi:pP-loop family protein [Clostridium sp. CAG:557]|jgi:tRNA 2-thiocytidine biosynthesis protein TtcA|nr:pP-loop family protein [Clostridium sp. CAG:557]
MHNLIGKVRSAIDSYKMISENDKIAVCLSGGKDSVFLLYALNQIKAYYTKKFNLAAITIDPCFDNIYADYSKIEKLCAQLNINYVIKRTQLGNLIFNVRKEKNPCSLCARMRRGMLHDLANELNCNKIALGHNLEDCVETFFMNLLNCGTIDCFSPVTYLSRKDLHAIRPLIFCEESKIFSFVNRKNLPIVESRCPANFNTNRQTTKKLIFKLEKKYPNLRKKIIGALKRAKISGWDEYF